MSWDTYANFARFGFIAVIIVIQIPFVRFALSFAVRGSLMVLAWISALHETGRHSDDSSRENRTRTTSPGKQLPAARFSRAGF